MKPKDREKHLNYSNRTSFKRPPSQNRRIYTRPVLTKGMQYPNEMNFEEWPVEVADPDHSAEPQLDENGFLVSAVLSNKEQDYEE